MSIHPRRVLVALIAAVECEINAFAKVSADALGAAGWI